ncbi:delta subunit of the central stalk of mitochondrial F1F0 ATP synthase, atp16 [Entophlyctis luteolus]|nr:delta subunit of the central stalk of mitochondrial F1F0 ATP synthase, atp16 [Entophlyctis luteolus]
MRFLRSLRPLYAPATAFSRRSFASETTASSGGKLRVSFVLPHQTILNDFEAIQVNLQSSEGDMGILADHVPIIAQLNHGGVVEIVASDNKPRKYFVSGGFAVMNVDSSLNINAVEAVPIEDLDPSAAKQGLDEAVRKLNASGASEKEKAEARIEQELFEAVIAAAKA